MATISVSAYNDSSARTAGEAITITSGAVYTVRTDHRVHANAPDTTKECFRRRNCGVYVIKNLINGKIYVGQSRNIKGRFRAHKIMYKKQTSKCSALYSAIRKYGIENFNFSVYRYCSVLDLNKIEEMAVRDLGSLSPNGYNLRSGGNEKLFMLESTKKLISAKNKGKVRSKESIENVKRAIAVKYPNGRPAWNKGQKTTGEALEKLLRRNRSRRGIPSWNSGTPTPESVRKKQSEAAKNRKVSEETKNKLRSSMLGRKITWGDKISKSLSGRDLGQAWRDKLSICTQKNEVIFCSNGKTYYSIVSAGKDTGTHPANILKVCKGERKTTGGLFFVKAKAGDLWLL